MLESLLASPFAIAGLIVWALLAGTASVLLVRRVSTTDRGAEVDIVRRVLRNSSIPIASQLLIRATDLGVAIVILRLLGPEGNGQYAIAVIVWLYVKTISDFGLSLLATRDIARHPGRAGQIVGATTLLRLAVLGVAAIPVAIYVLAGLATGSLAVASALAIAVLYLSIAPSSYAEAVNSALNGVERMDVAAWLNIGVSLTRAPLVILLATTRLEVTGVALAALVAALFSAELYRRAFRGLIGQPIVWSLGREQARALASQSWPLLVNALLVNLFFRVDVFIVQAFRGDAALGIYDASYKLINLVTIVPAYVTLAVFPTMAARAGDREALVRTQHMASYLLVWIAWGIVVAGSTTAETAIRVLAGSAYLPEAAALLRILIWFAPLSFLNGVVQYVLVAADQQRRIVPAFLAAVTFNLLANLALVPLYGARAAAAATVATEVVILLGFAFVTRRGDIRVVAPSTIARLWRPTAAGVFAALVGLALLERYHEFVAATAALSLFALLSLGFGVFGAAERDILRRAIGRSSSAERDEGAAGARPA